MAKKNNGQQEDMEELQELFQEINLESTSKPGAKILQYFMRNPFVPIGMGVTTYFFVKAARVLGTDSFAFADALKGRVAAQAITVGFILVGAWSLKRESYNKQVASSMVNEINIKPPVAKEY